MDELFQEEDIHSMFIKLIADVKNIGGLPNNEEFWGCELLPSSPDGEDRLRTFEIGTLFNEFIYKNLQFHCKALFNDMISLAQKIDHKIEIKIGDAPTHKTSWATTIMIDKQLNSYSKQRGDELYKMLRLCGFVNSIANTITSFALIMENQHQLFHYTKVPIQFIDIANEYMLDYVVNLQFCMREFTKPGCQYVNLVVHIPHGICNTKILAQRTSHKYIVEEEILHGQFYHQPIDFPAETCKKWTLNVCDDFNHPGHGFLLFVPFHRKWNIDCFTLLLWNYIRVPLYCTRLASGSNCMWFLLAKEENTTIRDIADMTKLPEIPKLLDLTKIEGAKLIMSNSNGEELSFPKDKEFKSCLMWHHFNLYRQTNGVAGNVMSSE